MAFRNYLLVALLGFAACDARSPTAREAGALTGAALGAGLGAIVGNQVGNPGAGVAIGGAFGAVSGGLVGNEMDAQHERLDRREDQIQSQQRQIDENRRLIQDLRSRGVDARGTDRGVVVNLPDVLFEFDRARLTGEARETIGEIVGSLRKMGGRRIAVEGHTDSVGTLEYNHRLSLDRARSVADELHDRGISSRRLSVRGYGEERPIASNQGASGRAKNRRVEVIIENR